MPHVATPRKGEYRAPESLSSHCLMDYPMERGQHPNRKGGERLGPEGSREWLGESGTKKGPESVWEKVRPGVRGAREGAKQETEGSGSPGEGLSRRPRGLAAPERE